MTPPPPPPPRDTPAAPDYPPSSRPQGRNGAARRRTGEPTVAEVSFLLLFRLAVFPGSTRWPEDDPEVRERILEAMRDYEFVVARRYQESRVNVHRRIRRLADRLSAQNKELHRINPGKNWSSGASSTETPDEIVDAHAEADEIDNVPRPPRR